MVKISELIEKKIYESNSDEITKEFLKKMVYLQLDHISDISEGGKNWKYGKELDRLVKEYTAKSLKNKNVD